MRFMASSLNAEISSAVYHIFSSLDLTNSVTQILGSKEIFRCDDANMGSDVWRRYLDEAVPEIVFFFASVSSSEVSDDEAREGNDSIDDDAASSSSRGAMDRALRRIEGSDFGGGFGTATIVSSVAWLLLAVVAAAGGKQSAKNRLRGTDPIEGEGEALRGYMASQQDFRYILPNNFSLPHLTTHFSQA